MYLSFILLDSGFWDTPACNCWKVGRAHPNTEDTCGCLWCNCSGVYHITVPKSSAVSWFNHLIEDNMDATDRVTGSPYKQSVPFHRTWACLQDLQTLMAHQVGRKMLLLVLQYPDAVTRFPCRCHESWLSVLEYLCLAWSAKSLYWAIFYGKIETARTIGLKTKIFLWFLSDDVLHN